MEGRRSSLDEMSIRDAFAIFDVDNSGTLSADELVSILTQPTEGNRPLTEVEVRELIGKFDTNGDGVLQVDEFVRAFSAIMPLAVGTKEHSVDKVARSNEPIIAHFRQGLDPVDALRLRDNLRRLVAQLESGTIPSVAVLEDVVGKLSKMSDDASKPQLNAIRGDVRQLITKLDEALKEEAKVTKVEKPLESYRNPHVRSAQEMQRSKGEQVPITARLKVRDLQVILKDLRRVDLLYFKS